MRHRTRWHKRGLVITAAATAAFLASIPNTATSQTDVEFRGGYYSDVEEGFLGGGLVADLGNSWDLNPNLEWVLTDGYDYLTVNGDLHYDFNAQSSGPAIWAGTGLAVVHTSPDAPRGNDETDLGVNLVGGVGAKSGSVRPFMQLKGRVADNSETSVALGLRF